MQHFNGLAVIVSDRALAESKERLFPESRHRSKRIHKKLVKRFGGEFRMVPAIWQIAGQYIMHPVRYAELQAAIAAQAR